MKFICSSFVMKRWHCICFIFFCFSLPGLAQENISFNQFASYFDFAGIEHNQTRTQIILSATGDEIGLNREKYKIGKNIFSLNYSFSYKRLLPNIGGIWTPQTQNWMMFLPINGIMGAVKMRWYFNNRKFNYVGYKFYGGYLWTQDKEMPKEIGMASGPSLTNYQVDWVNNLRIGADLTVGRKYINKFMSEITLEVGWRMDYSNSRYECIYYCGGFPGPYLKHEWVFIPHIQVILGFDL